MSSKSVFVEHSKECQVFRRRTEELVNIIKEKDKTVMVLINQDIKPRRGVFEVTVEGNVVFALHGMPRPFNKLRETDMEKVAADIISAVQKAEDGSAQDSDEAKDEVVQQELKTEEEQADVYEEAEYAEDDFDDDSEDDYSPPKKSRKKSRNDEDSDYEETPTKKKKKTK